jgi:hypothetical protein
MLQALEEGHGGEVGNAGCRKQRGNKQIHGFLYIVVTRRRGYFKGLFQFGQIHIYRHVKVITAREAATITFYRAKCSAPSSGVRKYAV